MYTLLLNHNREIETRNAFLIKITVVNQISWIFIHRRARHYFTEINILHDFAEIIRAVHTIQLRSKWICLICVVHHQISLSRLHRYFVRKLTQCQQRIYILSNRFVSLQTVARHDCFRVDVSIWKMPTYLAVLVGLLQRVCRLILKRAFSRLCIPCRSCMPRQTKSR